MLWWTALVGSRTALDHHWDGFEYQNSGQGCILNRKFPFSCRHFRVNIAALILAQVELFLALLNCEKRQLIQLPVSLEFRVQVKSEETVEAARLQQVQAALRTQLCKFTDDALELRRQVIVVVFDHDGRGLIVQEAVDHHDQRWQLDS